VESLDSRRVQVAVLRQNLLGFEIARATEQVPVADFCFGAELNLGILPVRHWTELVQNGGNSTPHRA